LAEQWKLLNQSLELIMFALIKTRVTSAFTHTAKVPSRKSLISLAVLAAVGAAAYSLWTQPPFQAIDSGSLGIRSNRLTGEVKAFRDGSVLMIPGVHSLRQISTLEQTYRPSSDAQVNGYQSLEGLALGIDFIIRYSIDPQVLANRGSAIPLDVRAEVVEPAIAATVHKILSSHTVREIFSTKRAAIQQKIEAELKTKLSADGVILKTVQIGKVELPEEYRKGMESLMAEELASEKMRFTLELRAKQLQQRDLETDAEKLRREKLAQAAVQEHLIAAKGQEEAMKHVIPFKERQIAQRSLEAEAEKQARIRNAEGSAQARRIEAAGEAESRQKLADAEAYRQDRLGKVASEQMAREGALISRHPLLIQKAMVDKLSDKINVIVAPTGTDGKFLGAAIAGDFGSSDNLRTVSKE
jgi:regulator of protease activity HflC (stomatin/prohibitin superfamily)